MANNPLSATDPSGYKAFWKKEWFITAVVVVAAVYTGGLAAGAVYSAGISATATVATAEVGAYVVGAQIGSAAVGGFVTGAIVGGAQGYAATGTGVGTLNGALKGGVVSGLSAGATSAASGIESAWGRIGAKSTIGGAQNVMQGGSFRDGFVSAGTMAGLSEAGWAARRIAGGWADNNAMNMGGSSAGIRGDGLKRAGGLISWDTWLREEPFGGCQGCPGMLVGVPYPAGGVVDRVLESFAGPHDFLSGLNYIRDKGVQDDINPNLSLAYSGAMLPFAAPFAAATFSEEYGLGSLIKW